ncbi:MAG: hypothetical protein ACPG8W_03555 [Candidatus Promineifilaceae bacterium]
MHTTILTGISWAFGDKPYTNYEQFIQDVAEYNQTLLAYGNVWSPTDIVCTGPIRIQYEAYWKSEDNFLIVEIGTAGEPLSTGQLLFTLSNAAVDFFSEADHRYFEGLDQAKLGVYWLRTGS